MKYAWLFLWFILQSCHGLDDDTAYAYQRRAIFASWIEPSTHQLHLAELIQNQDRWQSNISSFCIQPDGIWVGKANLMTYYDLVKGQNNSFSLDLEPHWIVADENYLVVADSLQNKLAFYHIKNHKIKDSYTTTLSQTPKGLFLKQGRVSVVGKWGKLEVYDAGSATILYSKEYGDTVKYAGIDNLYNVLLGSQVERKFNLNTLTESPALTSTWDSVAFSPLRNSVYETEFLGKIGLKNKQLNLTGWTERVDKFWPDFQNSEIFYTRHDSLFYTKIGGISQAQPWQREFYQLGFYWNMRSLK